MGRDGKTYRRAEGHSTRAIAGALGVSAMTVLRDAGVTGDTPDANYVDSPQDVMGRDGKTYRRAKGGTRKKPALTEKAGARRDALVKKASAGG